MVDNPLFSWYNLHNERGVNMEEIISLIANQGFAIAMASYVIVVVNKSINEMTKAVLTLTEKLENLEGEK